MGVEALISRATLDHERWPAYVLSRRLRIAQVNSAWDVVARQADGPLAHEVLGTPLLDWIAGDELRAWYESLLERLLRRRSGETFLCDCNTPARYRRFATRFESFKKPDARGPNAVIVTTSLLEDAPVAERYRLGAPDEKRYRHATGLIVQCSGCRRVEVAGSSPRAWEFVSAWVARCPSEVSHGICGLCREINYGMVGLRAS